MEQRVLFVFLLTAFINFINTLTRSSRLVGVRTASLATALSLTGVVYLAASFANTLQAPLLASAVEGIIKDAYAAALLQSPAEPVGAPVYREALGALEGVLRLVMLGAALGSAAGLLAVPSFVATFANAVRAFGRTGSVLGVALLFLSPAGWRAGGAVALRWVSRRTLKELVTRRLRTPAAFLFWNLASYCLWTVNVLAGLYAGALYPEFRQTAVLMAAVVGNASIVTNVLMVDPVLAKVTDAVSRGAEEEAELKQIIFYLALTNLAGTLLAQLLFVPTAQALKYFTVLTSR